MYAFYKKLLAIIIAVMLVILLFILYIYHYKTTIKKYEKRIPYCEKFIEGAEFDTCYTQSFNLLFPELLIYKYTLNNNQKDKLVKIESKENRFVSLYALEQSDVLIGYGIWDNIEFEDYYSLFFNKPSWGFDCSADIEKLLKIKSDKCRFCPECIGTDKYILDWLSSNGKIHSFDQKIKELSLENKKIYLKMDIAGAEKEVMPDILKHSEQITGLSLTFHIMSIQDILKAKKIMQEINKDFVLIARNSAFPASYWGLFFLNGDFGNIILFDNTIVLSFINKNLVKNSEISWTQNAASIYRRNYVYNLPSGVKNPNNFHFINVKNDISLAVTFTEKYKVLKRKIWKILFKE